MERSYRSPRLELRFANRAIYFCRYDPAVRLKLSLVHITICDEDNLVDSQTMRDRIALLEVKRGVLVQLLDQPDLGTLRIDVNQALEEMDDLIDEFKKTFPANA